MAKIPLLMLNGELDGIIPASKVQDFFRLLKPQYKYHETIELHIHADVGHADNLPMNVEIVQWLLKYL